MKANINRVVSRLEDIYQCGKKEDGTYTRMAFSDRKSTRLNSSHPSSSRMPSSA